MNEHFLLKLGEIVLKGQNRWQFENKLKQNVNRRMRPFGSFRVSIVQSTVFVEPQSEECDMDGAWDACRYIFGVVSICRCRACPKDLDAVFDAVREFLDDDLLAAKSFKVESKRSDKRFPLNSIQISQEIGGRIAEAYPHLKVDVHNPEYIVNVEIRDQMAYVHGPAEPGAGGLPTGVGGRAMVLLSGGIDSPVAAYMMAKRGLELMAVHFASPPYTSQRAEEKVAELLQRVARYSGRLKMYTVPFTEIQEQIREHCKEDYFTIIMRRFMMEIAQRLAADKGAQALITGESLGQVASQTIGAIACTDAVCKMPVFRPLLGMDKEEIIEISRKIDTFEVSIQPYEDCCTVFTPKHPRTRPVLEKVLEEESKLDALPMIERAVQNVKVRDIH